MFLILQVNEVQTMKKSNYLQEMIQGRNDMTGVDTTEFMILDEQGSISGVRHFKTFP